MKSLTTIVALRTCVAALATAPLIAGCAPATTGSLVTPHVQAERRSVTSIVPARIYLLRGLANIFSLGMDDLTNKLRAEGYDADVDEHGSWEAISDRLIEQHRRGHSIRAIVLVGHSLGANAVLLAAHRLGEAKVPVDLLVTFDAVAPVEVPWNVVRVINYFQGDKGWGHPLKPGAGFRGVLNNADVSSNRSDLKDSELGHTNIDKSAKIHADLIDELSKIKRVGTSPVKRQSSGQ